MFLDALRNKILVNLPNKKVLRTKVTFEIFRRGGGFQGLHVLFIN